MLIETDKLAVLDFRPESPEYELQQGLIRAAANYRLAQLEKEKEKE